MADIPIPRSYNVVVADMVNTLLSRVGIPSLRVGSPILSIIEAAAQSDVRSSQDVFGLLNSISLDRATGIALDRIGADEEVPRLPETASSGTVTISDSSFTKVTTKVYQGLAAPIIGSASINVVDASGFDATGQLYIGRGTANYEGPLNYTAKTDNGSYWTITLQSGSETQRFHNVGETVTFAQGGNRLISAGTIVQTAQSNASDAVQFATLYAATITDGETEVTGVTVVARKTGVVGNVASGAINQFVTSPFAGATVTNTAPFTNGQPVEDDKPYRERIRATRQSRSKGTPLAIKTAVTGIISPDENKRILSASVITRQGYPTTLYIDDGTGYEERTEGTAYEVLVDNAVGGEQYFQLTNGRPVTKAYALTSTSAPYALTSGAKLAVLVGGTRYEHTFDSSEFVAIGNATAYEVVASINGDSNIGFSARTYNNGTQVAIFADADTNEDIEVVAPGSGTDSNGILGFPSGRNDTIRLYKNDQLLTKDGQLATLTSNPQGTWGSMLSGETLLIEVDGIALPVSLTTFTNQDFIDAGTGYNTLSNSNSLAAWAAVINYKVPGVTAAESGGTLVLTSNADRSDRASLAVTGGTLVTKGMWNIGSATGKSNDYTLDRNLGQIRLEDHNVLVAGDKLTVGSLFTRAFLESDEISATTLSGNGTLWFAVDGSAEIIETGLGAGSVINYTSVGAPTWGKRIRLTAASGTPFTNVLPGDWLVITDSGFSAPEQGAWKIANQSSTYIDIERPSAYVPPASDTLIDGGFVIVRSSTELDKVTIPSGSNYTASSFVTQLNSQLSTAVSSTYKTNYIRVRSKTFGIHGDIMLVSADTEGKKLLLPEQELVDNLTPHLASIESSNSEAGTPSFSMNSISSVTSSTQFVVGSIGDINSGSILVMERAKEDALVSRYSNEGHRTPIEVLSGTTVTVREATLNEWLPEDRVYPASPFAIGPADDLTVLLDRDSESKRFAVQMYRKVKPKAGDVYGITTTWVDADNGNASLGNAFGASFNWKDFAVYMKARTKSHGAPDTNKTLLWRYYRHGAEGNRARLQYIYPTSASSAVSITTDATSTEYANVKVSLPSGAARTGYTVRNSTKVGMAVTAGPTAGLYDYIYVFFLNATNAKREVHLDYTGKSPTTAFAGTVTGGTSGATGTVVSDSGGAAGTVILSGVVGAFLPGESINDGTRTATISGSPYARSTITVTNPGAITNHGLQVGDVLYVNHGGAIGYTDGTKTVTTVTATTFTYNDTTVGSSASAPITGTVSFDPAGNVTLSGGSIVAGDIFNAGTSTSFGTSFKQAVKVATFANDYITAQSPTSNALSTTLTWGAINNTSNIAFYPLSSNTAGAIATAVNALSNAPVSAVATVSSGAGTIDYATYEATPNGLGGTDPWYYLSDGLNWVRSTSYVTDYTFTLKDAVTAALTTNNDWTNEDIRLVPITAENLVNYLNADSVSGLGSSAEVAASSCEGKIQIASDAPGYEGAVQVQGGTSNSVSAACQTSAININSSKMSVSVNSSDATGLRGGMWCRIENSIGVPKDVIDANTNLDSITSGVVVFDSGGTKAWEWANTATGAINGLRWQVEKQGDFVAFVYISGGSPNLAGINEGDFVMIDNSAVSSANDGNYRIVRIDDTNKIFWIENANAVAGIGTVDLKFVDYNSIMPGDKLVINTTLWGANNTGTYTVTDIHATNRWTFTISPTPTNVSAPGPAALGSNSDLVKVIEGQPSSLIKKIRTISPNSNSNLTDIMFETHYGYAKVGLFAGSIVKALDKLDFGTTENSGLDGYEHSTGLIAEANKVCYGDDSDTSSYPGVVAAGATVNISGPLVKRVQISLSVRLRTGISTTDVADKVKSSVAAVINNTGIGESIAISDLIAAASGVNGVIAVAVVSPSFSVTNDLIATQPYEKPLVLNVDQDISVSFVGE